MKRLQALLTREADASYAVSLRKYMKEIMPCRGVRMPVIQSTVRQWKAENSAEVRPAATHQ
jgi:hypothetical protein